MSMMLQDKRSTRGKRMTALVGKAQEEDEAFWGGESAWQELEEGSDAESFRSDDEEQQPDEFDSDFNDTESGSSDDSDAAAPTATKKKRAATKSSDEKMNESNKKKANVYKDPSITKRPTSKVSQQSTAGKRRLVVPQDDDVNMRQVRASTTARTKITDAAAAAANKSSQKKRRFRIPTKFSQEELLREALDTEEANARWLLTQRLEEIERGHDKQKDNQTNSSSKGSFIRFVSRRGAPNSVTFSAVEAMPLLLRADCPRPTLPQQQQCVVTGLPAKYRDPLTGHAYATIEAFQIIRQQYQQQQQQSQR